MTDKLNPTAVAEQFYRDGIVALPGFLDAHFSQHLATELDAVVQADPDRPFGGGPEYVRQREVKVRVWPGKDCSALKEAADDPRLAAVTEAILGCDYIVQDGAIFSTPTGGGQSWHQDSRSREPWHFELNRIFFPSDVDPEQGGLLYVPGSHAGPDLPPGDNYEPLPGQVRYLPTAGTLVLMHTRCFHCVEINRSDKPRTQCNSRSRAKDAPTNLGSTPVFRTGLWNFSTSLAE